VPEGWSSKDLRIKGWNVESIVQTQKAKWSEFQHLMQPPNNVGAPVGVAHEAPVPSNTDYAAHNTMMAFAYVIALTAHKKGQISLLDWGGGIGHYYVISKALLPEVTIDYHCKDLPLLCEVGRELLPEANFYENEEDCFARTYDLVLASSSLHYSEDWQRIAQRLALATGSYLYVTRLPIINRKASFVVVQRPYQFGYETEYLCWFLNREEFLIHMSTLEMDLVREFLIQEKPHVYGAPEQGDYRGFLFRPRHGEVRE
jgi:putative methyltransferase (TIGR04325 family)